MGCASSSVQTGAAAEVCASLDRFERDFEVGALLGRGSDGEVYCASECATGAEIAVKVISFEPQGASAPSRSPADPSRRDPQNAQARKRKRAWAEVEMLRAVGEHPNIVRLHGSFTTDDASYVLMERCECAIPVKFDSNPQLLQEGLPRVFRGMLTGISACHRARVVHRDVKMENYLMGIDGVTVKLCDFGVSRRLPPSVKGLSGAAGTVPMMSPEMVLGDLYDFGTDVWSFGAMAYLIIFGELPYVPKEMSRSGAKEAIRAGWPSPRFLGARGPRADFLRPLLERDPLWRCSADEALEHPFLRDPPRQPPVDPRGLAAAETLEVSHVHLELQSIQGSLELLKSINGSAQGSINGNEPDSEGESVINIDDYYLCSVDPNKDEVDPNKVDPNNNDTDSVEQIGTFAVRAHLPLHLSPSAVDA